MTPPEIITLLLKKQNRTQKELSDFLGLSQSAITDWKKGKTESYKDYLPEISEFFSVSIDYIMTGEDTKKEPPPSDGRWERFKAQYDSMSPEERSKMDKILDAMFPTDGS